MQVKKIIVKKSCKDSRRNVYEIWTNGIADECGRKRLEVGVKSLEGVRGQEGYAYALLELISDLRHFLIERKIATKEILSVQKFWVLETDQSKPLLMIEDVKHLGFKTVVEEFPEGLDYEHSVLVISTMARFHAASYAFRKSTKSNWNEKYPDISSDVEVPKLSMETTQMLEDIFEKNIDYAKYSWLFMGPVRGEMEMMNKKLESFGVLSHGNCITPNMLFRYKKAVDCKQFCSEVILKDPLNFKYNTCVLDLLQFIFTSIDPQVRQSFMPDFVCSVYYDNFVKTVCSIDNTIPVFSKKSFIKEFDQIILYGFLFSVDYHSAHQEQAFNEDKTLTYKKNILAIMRDLIQFKLNTKVTLNMGARLK